jgi:hypothetical protein
MNVLVRWPMALLTVTPARLLDAVGGDTVEPAGATSGEDPVTGLGATPWQRVQTGLEQSVTQVKTTTTTAYEQGRGAIADRWHDLTTNLHDRTTQTGDAIQAWGQGMGMGLRDRLDLDGTAAQAQATEAIHRWSGAIAHWSADFKRLRPDLLQQQLDQGLTDWLGTHPVWAWAIAHPLWALLLAGLLLVGFGLAAGALIRGVVGWVWAAMARSVPPRNWQTNRRTPPLAVSPQTQPRPASGVAPKTRDRLAHLLTRLEHLREEQDQIMAEVRQLLGERSRR